MIRLHYKKGTLQRVILVIIGFAVIAVCVAAALAYFLPQEPKLKDGDIVIGDTTITRKQINDYAESIELYKKNNPKAVFESDSSLIASDDLIMNAALKYYAKKFGKVVTSKDVLAEAFIIATTNEEADNIIESKLGEKNSLMRIRNENIAYQKKLIDYVLATKSLFSIKVGFDSPYFTEMPIKNVQSAYDSAISRLETEYMPLFKSKLSKEDISKKADVVYFDDDYSDDLNHEQYQSRAVVGASFDIGYRADGNYYNNLETTDYIRGDVGKMYSMDEKIASLKNVGDYTNVFSSKNGTFSIIRLESKSEGEFNSWKDMLESFKSKYAYEEFSMVVSDVSYGSQTIVNNTIKSIASYNVDNVNAVNPCPSHRVTFIFNAYDTSHVKISGASMLMNGVGWCEGDSGDRVFTSSTGAPPTITYNCNGGAPYYYRIGDPSGYTYVSTTSPEPDGDYGGYYHSGYAQLGTQYSNGQQGFPRWVPLEMNGLGHPIYVNFYYAPNNIWSSAPSVSVNKTTAKPGEKIIWEHSVSNAGPDPTNLPVNFYYVSSGGFSPATVWRGVLASGTAAGVTSTVVNSEHFVNQDNVGKTLCRKTMATPDSGGGTGSAYSLDACVTIPYDYTLTPNVGLNNSKAIESDTEFTVTPTVSNTGPTKSQATAWQLTKIIIAPTESKPTTWNAMTLGTEQPCGTYFNRTNIDCSTVSSGNTVFNSTGSVLSGDSLNAQTINSEDYSVGTKICFALSLKPHSSSDPNWAYSEVKCLTVGVRPKLQVWGGDLIVGGNSITSTSRKRIDGVSRTFGSWVEYGIFAEGVIDGTASGSAFAGPGLVINNPNNTCGYSKLSFSLPERQEKCKTNLTIGNYDTGRGLPDISASLQGTTSAIGNDGPVVTDSLVSDAGGTYIGSRDGDLRLDPSTLSPGKSVILKVTGTVYINGDQYYEQDYNGSGYTNIKQLPQLVIIANKIVINRDVTNVDAWLVATNVDGSGTLETCDIIGNTIDTCNKPLLVNGPVIANKISFRRTGGSGQGAASGDPAEIFNLRPDSYLWAISRTSGLGRIQTVNITELPPRL